MNRPIPRHVWPVLFAGFLTGLLPPSSGLASENGTWLPIIDSGGPVVRGSHTAIYDRVRDRMLVFGGFTPNTLLDDLWALSLTGSPAWSSLPYADPPSARSGHSAAYDQLHDRMLVFGGDNASEVWALSFAGSPAWSQIAATGTPPSARNSLAAIYDPVRDRMLIFGGGGGFTFLNDVWALSLGESPAWSELSPAGDPPPGRQEHAAIYDPVCDCMVAFGGRDDNLEFRNDVWVLSLADLTWSEMIPAGSPPSPRVVTSAIYDPVRKRMVIFGGLDASNLDQNDVWALSLGADPTWTQLEPLGTPPIAREQHTAIYDPVRDRMWVFGGDRQDLTFLQDVWVLDWEDPVSVPGENVRPARLVLAPPRPNPSRGDFTIDFSVPRAETVSILVLDVTGRILAKLVDGPQVAGTHTSHWDGRDLRGRHVPSGIYLVKLLAPDAQIGRNVVVLDPNRHE